MMILKGASTSEVRQQAMEDGMVPLMKDGMLKVKEGITTPAEVLRNAYFIE
jgi:type II secretory ATPase GspE/PulE/Tfp pilus assembly ATPase PilB-like protein